MPVETHPDDGHLDLVLTRIVKVPRPLVWKAWTDPDLLMQWFAPHPWTTVACEIDLRPGGIFRTVMRSPEGEEFGRDGPGGCILEVVKHERLVWTDVLGPGFRPAREPFFTAVITLEEVEGGTRYTARAMHKDDADRDKHAAMGFEAGWSQCLDQLVTVMTR